MKVNEENYSQLENYAQEIRKRVVDQIYSAQSGHPGASLSSAEILSTLYFHEMDLDKDDPDRFILSKGHAVPAQYAALSIKYPGQVTSEDLETLRVAGSKLQGHPVAGTLPHILASTGSLGQGLSIASGMAYAKKHANKSGRVYVVLGDGELQEGQNWEALMTASHKGLDNLLAIVDRNKFQNDGEVESTMSLEPLEERLSSFGWNVITVDGHNVNELVEAYESAKSTKGKPSIIIAETTKGKGIDYIEKNPARSNISKDGGAMGEDSYREAISSLGFNPGEVTVPRVNAITKSKTDDKATRDAFGEALVEAGEKYDGLVVVDCDLGSATRAQKFGKEFPERFIRVGIAEQDGVSFAAGLAQEGLRPFMTSFSSFLTNRAKDQIMNSVAYSNSPVVLVGSHSGLAIGKDGATQMGIDDLNAMWGIPGLEIYSPADDIETRQIVEHLAGSNNMAYLRISRRPQPNVHDENYQFSFNKAEVLRDGNDLAFFATGDMVLYAMQSAQDLERKGISASVINLATLNPLDKEGILKISEGKKGIVTLEDHLADHGLGLRIKGTLAEEGIGVPVKSIGISGFGESGDPDDLYKKHGMDRDGVTKTSQEFYEKIK